MPSAIGPSYDHAVPALTLPVMRADSFYFAHEGKGDPPVRALSIAASVVAPGRDAARSAGLPLGCDSYNLHNVSRIVNALPSPVALAPFGSCDLPGHTAARTDAPSNCHSRLAARV